METAQKELINLYNSKLDYNNTRKKLKILIKPFSPSEQIFLYKSYYNYLSKQGTAEWLNERKIGGSTVYKILTNPIDAAKYLLDITPFKGNIDTQWGSMMEKVAYKYLAKYIDIVEFGAIPGYCDLSGILRTTYSPDGIFEWTDRADPLGAILEINYDTLKNKVVLLEIKCPSRRSKGDMPDMYIPQIQMGLSTTICDICLYMEFFVKRCSIKDFNFNWRTTPNFSKFKQISAPIAIGFVGFYGSISDVIKEKIENPIYVESFPLEFYMIDVLSVEILFEIDRIIDKSFSYASSDLRAEYLCRKFKHHAKTISQYYRCANVLYDGIDFGSTNSFFHKSCDPQHYNYNYYYSNLLTENVDVPQCTQFLESEIANFRRTHDDAIGIMCFKLFDINAFIVEKQLYLNEIKTVIKFAKKIDEIRENPQTLWLNCITKMLG